MIKRMSIINAKRRQQIWGLSIATLCLTVLAIYLSQRRVLTPFSAIIRTKSISFCLGRWNDDRSAGLFNSQVRRVDVTLQSSCLIRQSEKVIRPSIGCYSGLRLGNVRLTGLDTSLGRRLFLRVNDTVYFRLSRGPDDARAGFATILLDSKSRLADKNLAQSLGPNDTIEWSISPADGSPFAFNIDFHEGAAPEPELMIPVQEGSDIRFGNDVIPDATNLLTVAEQRRSVDERLALANLHDAHVVQLSLIKRSRSPNLDSIRVTLKGESDRIQNGSRNEAARRLDLHTGAAGLTLFFAALSAIATALYYARELTRNG